MHWLIKCRSKPNSDELRLATIDAHRRFLDGYSEVTWYSGPIFSDDNKNAIGSLRLIEFPDRAAALAYIHSDPYTKAGLFETINIERWDPRFGGRQRDYPRKDGRMQFVIHCRDKPDGEARRAPLRAEHHERLNAHKNITIVRGPLMSDDGSRMVGSLLLLDVADKKQAETFWADGPFVRAGVYDWWTIERWRFGHV